MNPILSITALALAVVLLVVSSRDLNGEKALAKQDLKDKLEALTDPTLIDRLANDFARYKRYSHFTMYQTQWKSWIRR